MIGNSAFQNVAELKVVRKRSSKYLGKNLAPSAWQVLDESLRCIAQPEFLPGDSLNNTTHVELVVMPTLLQSHPLYDSTVLFSKNLTNSRIEPLSGDPLGGLECSRL